MDDDIRIPACQLSETRQTETLKVHALRLDLSTPASLHLSSPRLVVPLHLACYALAEHSRPRNKPS